MGKSFINWLLVGGASLLLVPLMLVADLQPTLRPEYLLLFSFPHFVLSYFIYFKHAKLSSSQRRSLITLLLPVVVLLAIFSSFKSAQAYVVYLAQAIFFYHIALQAFGVTMVYSRALRSDRYWRWACKGTLLFWGAYAFIEQQTSFSTLTMFETNVESLQFSKITAAGMQGAAFGMTLVCLITFCFRRSKIKEPNLVADTFSLTGLLSFVAWCVPASRIAASGLIAIFHGLQYLPFAVENLRTKSQSRWAVTATVVASLAIGALVFDRVPKFLSQADPINSTFIISCLYLALNLTHFFLERVVWKKFKMPQVA
jgi:hypothetical protein